MATVKISDLIAEFLVDKDMRQVFGIIGAGNAHIFDAIGSRDDLEMVCVHHEQAATMAMQTYYRTSDRITAAILTTGAGSTNGLTGVVSAWADSIPGIVISGNENSRFTHEDNPLRMWGVQGYDSSGAVAKVTKYAVRVSDPTAVLYELEKAYHIASTGRPGPVWIDVPMDVQAAKVDRETLAIFTPDEPDSADDAAFDAAVAQVRALLDAAERPVLWLGNGIRLAGAADRVQDFVEALGVPALVSWAGIDMLDSDHPLVYGRAGVYGQRAANFVLQNADLVIAVGTRLSISQIGYVIDELARAAKIVVVDIDPAEATKHGERVSIPIVADAADFIDAMRKGGKRPARTDWIAQCDRYRRDYPWIGPEHDDQAPFINSYQVLDRLVHHLKSDQIVVTDMGTALLSGHQVMRFRNGQRLMTSTGLGEMGYGLPAAIGASFARDRGEVMCLNCDGGMMMNLQELQTVVHHQLPIKLFIFNNDGYLMIKHTQSSLFSGRNVGVDRKSGVTCPDFSALAVAWGIPAFQIRSWDDFDTVIPRVQAAQGPVICEVFMHPQQMFLPKLSLALKPDGSIVSPPLEDLSPLLPREAMREAMIVGLHPKSADL